MAIFAIYVSFFRIDLLAFLDASKLLSLFFDNNGLIKRISNEDKHKKKMVKNNKFSEPKLWLKGLINDPIIIPEKEPPDATKVYNLFACLELNTEPEISQN